MLAHMSTGFVGAMISNVAFVFRNIFSKKGMTTGKNVGGMNYYACLSMMSLVFLTPFAFAVEGPKMWTTGWNTAIQLHGNKVFWYLPSPFILGVILCHYLNNEILVDDTCNEVLQMS